MRARRDVSAGTTRQTHSVTLHDLTQLGFTDEAIARLSRRRAIHPYVEFVETAQQWQRLHFLRWRVRHGDLAHNPRSMMSPEE